MKEKPELFLHEEVTLLALSDEKGTVETGNWYKQVVGGAVLAELMRRDHVRVQTKNEAHATGSLFDRKPKLVVTNPQPSGDSLVDEWLKKIMASEKLRPVEYWLRKIAETPKLKARVAVRLVSLGILEKREDKVLWVFNRVVYPEGKAAPEQAIRCRLEEAIFNDHDEVDPGTVILLSLVKGGNFLPHLFDRKALKSRRQHIEDLISGEKLGAATKALIESIQAAAVVVTVVATSS